nr:hypothetical protein [Massilia litorea]
MTSLRTPATRIASASWVANSRFACTSGATSWGRCSGDENGGQVKDDIRRGLLHDPDQVLGSAFETVHGQGRRRCRKAGTGAQQDMHLPARGQEPAREM